jgi:hypothetical protein
MDLPAAAAVAAAVPADTENPDKKNLIQEPKQGTKRNAIGGSGTTAITRPGAGGRFERPQLLHDRRRRAGQDPADELCHQSVPMSTKKQKKTNSKERKPRTGLAHSLAAW